ncbi:MAG: DUF4911 domain-containing protein [Veillonella dispar]|jgi:hypothetical protein|uniref:DUF4911 domain-containing protein n=1 Tax=Veillonella TaxID=29465 RepID=UPI00280BEDBF|nr:DUF4911 domain-containing protein [Veillonella dispar]MDU4878489.1 DUF4911 domain-containing protein [Veillonella dispar]MDU4885215.1 DUF4911 domain-containing protein [Veillonella dispar]MDU6960314.1 DUF4911 domain-containing protein [Veillonella dispar]
MRGTPLEPSKSIGAFPDVPDLETSGEEAYVFFHLEPKHTNYINRIIEGYEYLGVMTSVDTSGRCMLRCTLSTKPLAIEILTSLSDYVTIEK